MTIEKIDLERLIALKEAAERAAAAGAAPAGVAGAAKSSAEDIAAEDAAAGPAANKGEDSAANAGAGDPLEAKTHYAPHRSGESLKRPLPIHPKGRPRKLDAKIKQLITRLLSRGYTVKEAAAFVGCNEKTVRRARRSDSDFNERVHRASQVAGGELKEVMEQAAVESWRAAAWLLKHQHQRADRDRKLRALAREINSIEDPEDEVIKVVENPDFYGPMPTRPQSAK